MVENFDKEYFERYSGLRRSDVEFFEKFRDDLDYMKSFLWVPCGIGYGVHFLENLGKKSAGYDINKYTVSKACLPDKVKVGDIRRIPEQTDSWECVISIDLLEHLKFTEMVDATTDLFRVAKFCVVISICSLDFKWFWNDHSHILGMCFCVWEVILTEIGREYGFELSKTDPDSETFIFKWIER